MVHQLFAIHLLMANLCFFNVLDINESDPYNTKTFSFLSGVKIVFEFHHS